MYIRLLTPLACLLFLVIGFSSCSNFSQDYAPEKIYYSPASKHAAILKNNRVYAPKDAPPQVRLAIAAANRIVGTPYRHGGGHRKHKDSGYDCSGAVSYVLREARLSTQTRHSKLFLNYGSRGAGDWITVYAKNGHVFMTICGVRFDTGGGGGRRDDGVNWHITPRSAKGFVMRHPTGL